MEVRDGMNPAKLLGMKSRLKAFETAHPKFVRFLEAVNDGYLEQDNILEVCVRRPSGEQIKTNLRLSAEDLALLRDLKELKD